LDTFIFYIHISEGKQNEGKKYVYFTSREVNNVLILYKLNIYINKNKQKHKIKIHAHITECNLALCFRNLKS